MANTYLDLLEDYIPHEKQLPFHESLARFKSLTAGARAGKTYCAGREFMKRVMVDMVEKNSQQLRYWVVAPTSALVKVARREISTVVAGYECSEPPPPGECAIVVNWNKTEQRLTLFPKLKKDGGGGRVVIWFKSADRPDSLVAEGLDGVWVDEAARMKADAWRGNLRMRLSDRNGWGLFSTTPKGPNWYYTDIFLRGDKTSKFYDSQFESFHFKTIDNTSVPSLIEEVKKAKRELPSAYYKREYEASFEAFYGQVYEELDENTHRIDSLPKFNGQPMRFSEFVAGMDFGWNQGALVIAGLGYDGTWYVIKEVVEGQLVTVSESGRSWAKEIEAAINMYHDITIYCDDADPEAIRLLKRAGLPVRPAHKEVLNGIGRLAYLLHVQPEHGPKMKILRKCINTWRQLVGYHWDDYNGYVLDRPAPNQEDHVPDALRYAMYSKFKRGKVEGRRVTGY